MILEMEVQRRSTQKTLSTAGSRPRAAFRLSFYKNDLLCIVKILTNISAFKMDRIRTTSIAPSSTSILCVCVCNVSVMCVSAQKREYQISSALSASFITHHPENPQFNARENENLSSVFVSELELSWFGFMISGFPGFLLLLVV